MFVLYTSRKSSQAMATNKAPSTAEDCVCPWGYIGHDTRWDIKNTIKSDKVKSAVYEDICNLQPGNCTQSTETDHLKIRWETFGLWLQIDLYNHQNVSTFYSLLCYLGRIFFHLLLKKMKLNFLWKIILEILTEEIELSPTS